MIIKSDFKDFYDFALSGIVEPEKNITYFRKIEIDKKEKFHYLSNYYLNNNLKERKGIFYVLFCNKLYKGIETFDLIKDNIENINYEYLEDFNLTEKEIELKKYMERFKQPIVVLKNICNIEIVSPEFNYSWKLNYKERLKQEEFKKTLVKVAIKDKFLINGGRNLIINDSLKLIGFNKIKTAYEVYQEIEMYLNNQNNIEKEVLFNDKEKLIQHGFNNMSFKKRK
jgi:hypothetical protein